MVLSWDKPLFTLQIECMRGNKEREGWMAGRENHCTEITQFTPFNTYTNKNQRKKVGKREGWNECKPGCDYTF